MARSKANQPTARVLKLVEPGRDGILTAAARLFSDKGFEGTSINDLAREVGLSKATIYHYFPHKNQIYVDVILDTLAALCEFVEKAVEKETTAAGKYRAFAVSHAEFFDKNLPAYTTATVGFGGLQHPPERRRAVALRDRHEGNLRAVIEGGVRTGEFREVDPRMATRALLSCLNWMVRWYKPNGKQTAGELGAEFAKLLLEGMQKNSKAGSLARAS